MNEAVLDETSLQRGHAFEQVGVVLVLSCTCILLVLYVYQVHVRTILDGQH